MKNNTNIITGVFLVVLGVLFLLKNFNLFDFNLGDVFRLWPIALIYVGVEMLPVNPKNKTLLQTGVIILFFVALIALPYIRSARHYYEDDEVGFKHQVKQVDSQGAYLYKSKLRTEVAEV